MTLLKPKDFAARLGITTGTLAGWREAGHVPYVVTPTGRHLYPESALEGLLEFVAAGTQAAAAGPKPHTQQAADRITRRQRELRRGELAVALAKAERAIERGEEVR